ncbi:hypothetical protein Pmar_PMAR000796, partial [Perkinsus marinus ATCC 50983]
TSEIRYSFSWCIIDDDIHDKVRAVLTGIYGASCGRLPSEFDQTSEHDEWLVTRKRLPGASQPACRRKREG